MSRYLYVSKKFHPVSERTIEQAIDILQEYADQGFTLTLRQLYYQFVSRGFLPNTEKTYKALGVLISDARLAGRIDWLFLTDRTRFLRELPHWHDAESILFSAANSFHVDYWNNQAHRPEIWIEKDALVDVATRSGNKWDVPVFSCRGYVSQSELWSAGQRCLDSLLNGKKPIIFHLGDHDPSGIDMTRDIRERLRLFTGASVPVERLALTMTQIETYNPPPNPAKLTDTRAKAYVELYGDSSWELDALEPTVIIATIDDAVRSLIDFDKWEDCVKDETEQREIIRAIAKNYDRIPDLLNGNNPS